MKWNTKSLIKAMLVVLVLATLGNVVQIGRVQAAPSFNCDGPLSGVERLVCSNEALSTADLILASTYKWVLERAATLPLDKTAIQQGERQWLRSLAGACAITPQLDRADDARRFIATICLWDLYRSRRDDLSKIVDDADRQSRHLPAEPPAQESVEDISDAERLDAIIKDFQTAGLERLFGGSNLRIESCGDTLGYVVHGPGRDSSFAAHCRVRVRGTNVQVLMCDDDMVGKFAIRPSSENPSRDDVVHFVKTACPPGG